MIREMHPCLACGHPVELVCVEVDDVGSPCEIRGDAVTIHEEEIGWWDTACKNCGLYTPDDLVALRIDKQVEGFFMWWESEKEILNWLHIFLRECPEARQIAKEEVCDVSETGMEQ